MKVFIFFSPFKEFEKKQPTKDKPWIFQAEEFIIWAKRKNNSLSIFDDLFDYIKSLGYDILKRYETKELTSALEEGKIINGLSLKNYRTIVYDMVRECYHSPWIKYEIQRLEKEFIFDALDLSEFSLWRMDSPGHNLIQLHWLLAKNFADCCIAGQLAEILQHCKGNCIIIEDPHSPMVSKS